MPQPHSKERTPEDTDSNAVGMSSSKRTRPKRGGPNQETKHRKPAETAVEETETEALVSIQKALIPLALGSKRKVLSWFVGNYAVSAAPLQERGRADVPQFEDLAGLFEAAHPNTEADRVLAVCYFHNNVLNESDVPSRKLTDELRQIGHKTRNVSRALYGLNVRTPSLVMITTTGRGTHKRYRITSAGTKFINEMMRRTREAA